MADWIIRESVPEDEPCLVSMWLRSYWQSGQCRKVYQAHDDADHVRYWATHSPIVTGLIRHGKVRVACDPGRTDYLHGPAVILAWYCETPGQAQWLSVKHRLRSFDQELARELVSEVIGESAKEKLSMPWDMIELKRLGAVPEAWTVDKLTLGVWRQLSEWTTAQAIGADVARTVLETRWSPKVTR